MQFKLKWQQAILGLVEILNITYLRYLGSWFRKQELVRENFETMYLSCGLTKNTCLCKKVFERNHALDGNQEGKTH